MLIYIPLRNNGNVGKGKLNLIRHYVGADGLKANLMRHRVADLMYFKAVTHHADDQLLVKVELCVSLVPPCVLHSCH